MRVALTLALATLLWQCKLNRVGETSVAQSIGAADDALKVAVNYIGDRACVQYWQEKGDADHGHIVVANNRSMASQIVTHELDGPNGELISEEYRASSPRRKHLLLSGDRFFAKYRSKGSPLDMQTIADNCRRLVLSVDSDRPPTISFKEGFAVQDQLAGLEKMAEHRTFTCLEQAPFCAFKCTAMANCPNKKRYFTLIWPDKNTGKVQALVRWEDRGKRDSSNITIPHLTYTGDAPAMFIFIPPRSPLPDEDDIQVPGGTPTPSPEPPIKVLTTQEAEVTISAAERIADSDTAEITLQFTAREDIRRGLAGYARVAVSALNPYRFAVLPEDFSAPLDLHPPSFSSQKLYSGKRFFEMLVLDDNWTVGEKLTMKFILQLDEKETATFRVKFKKPTWLSQWKFFKKSGGSTYLKVKVTKH